MTLRRAVVAACLATCLVSAVDAAEPYVPIEERLTRDDLAAIGLTTAQLARLNRALRDAEARASDASTRPRSPAAMVVASGDAGSTAPMREAGLDSVAISARVRGRVSGWAPGTVFQLDNGQQWTVLKGTVRLPRAIDAPGVRLVPGIAGRWFVELDEDHPKARVYRTD